MVHFNLALTFLVVVGMATRSSGHSILEDKRQPEILPSPSRTQLRLTSPAEDHNLEKRSFYWSCTGVYDRELIGRLNRVCDDCYNVFRDNGVASGCRSNCYHNQIFLQCLEYLFPPRLRNQYLTAAQMVGK